jgi:hypothetical protein
LVPDAHARADDDARRAARLDAATAHLASIAPDRRARARRRVRMDAREVRARSRRRGARAVSYTVKQRYNNNECESHGGWMTSVRARNQRLDARARGERESATDSLLPTTSSRREDDATSRRN